MAINGSVQYKGGLLPDIIRYTVDPMSFPSGNPSKCHEQVSYSQPLIPPKRFDSFPPLTGGCSEGLGAFCFFFKHLHTSPCRDTNTTIFLSKSPGLQCSNNNMVLDGLREVKVKFNNISIENR